MAYRTRGITTFEFVPVHSRRRVAVLIGVGGWAATSGSAEDQALPFSTVDPRFAGDVLAIRWEPSIQLELGGALKILAGEVLGFAAQEVLRHTMLSALLAGLAWPMALTKLGYLVDNPWSVGLDRAARAGLVLADTLLARSNGCRPVTLAGYSLGARVIFFALLELARVHAFGIVENVYLFGAPLTSGRNAWLQASSVVSGKIVNGYVRSDWVLGFLFRATTGGLWGVAGLHPAPDVPGVVSIDVSALVNGHMAYRAAMPRLLRQCGVPITLETFEEENAREKDKKEAKKSSDQERKSSQETSRGDDPKNVESKSKENDETHWDLEEIRRELAEFDTHIKELPSSLPQLVLEKERETETDTITSANSSQSKRETPSGRVESIQMTEDEFLLWAAAAEKEGILQSGELDKIRVEKEEEARILEMMAKMNSGLTTGNAGERRARSSDVNGSDVKGLANPQCDELAFTSPSSDPPIQTRSTNSSTPTEESLNAKDRPKPVPPRLILPKSIALDVHSSPPKAESEGYIQLKSAPFDQTRLPHRRTPLSNAEDERAGRSLPGSPGSPREHQDFRR